MNFQATNNETIINSAISVISVIEELMDCSTRKEMDRFFVKWSVIPSLKMIDIITKCLEQIQEEIDTIEEYIEEEETQDKIESMEEKIEELCSQQKYLQQIIQDF
jgi:hypothetical protein